ncbi:hypothetical protein D6853_14385 [Butyrivibrio sp. X503]|uniref:hypothetical protein n=1 Tax=Butyrivibrio sp. X503 TaxID=2364878 RepID=UPI000EA9FDEB|nr:hypothetical protein [Butyrivibrio sp. X503]RKM54122.1 hypothetical protein D6853_14385 [Butyrivibrio sp. X503]
MSANIFSSLSGSYNYVNDMSNLVSDYSSIKNGSYGSLMKSYVKKVGNQNALDAYRKTGSTASVEAQEKETVKTPKTVKTVSEMTKEAAATTTKKTDSTVNTADKYEKLKSNWLDNQLKQYDKDATKTTAADTSVSLDTTV